MQSMGSVFLLGLEVRLTSKKSVELDEKLEIWVVALGSFSVVVPNMVTVEVDT